MSKKPVLDRPWPSETSDWGRMRAMFQKAEIKAEEQWNRDHFYLVLDRPDETVYFVFSAIGDFQDIQFDR